LLSRYTQAGACVFPLGDFHHEQQQPLVVKFLAASLLKRMRGGIFASYWFLKPPCDIYHIEIK
jgi:hypothetical protein